MITCGNEEVKYLSISTVHTLPFLISLLHSLPSHHLFRLHPLLTNLSPSNLQPFTFSSPSPIPPRFLHFLYTFLTSFPFPHVPSPPIPSLLHPHIQSPQFLLLLFLHLNTSSHLSPFLTSLHLHPITPSPSHSIYIRKSR